MKKLFLFVCLLFAFSGFAEIKGTITCTEKVKPFTLYLMKGKDTLATCFTKMGENGYVFNFPENKNSPDLFLFIKHDASYSPKIDFRLVQGAGYKLFNRSGKGFWLGLYDKPMVNDVNPFEVKRDIHAKILYGAKKNIPLSDNPVYLVSKAGDTLKTGQTDKYGDFEFTEVSSINTRIVVKNTEKIKNEKEIYLAKQNGIIVSKFIKTTAGFEYRILESDLVVLEKKEEEDSELKLSSFAKSSDKTVIITENIYYPSNEFKVSEEAGKKLDKIITTLKENKNYKLEVYSHTDSKGNDAANQTLSEKRAAAVVEYLVTKGIDRSRLTGKGMGESKLSNRCLNDVACSEKEHELNRRTEFKFIK